MKILLPLTLILSLIFFFFPEIDLYVSTLFYDEGQGFPWRDHIISVVIYRSIYVISYFLVPAYFLILVIKKFGGKKAKNAVSFVTSKQIFFLILVMFIAPGILIHPILKDGFSRARPVNIEEFGGKRNFTPAWYIANEGGKSFASGHAAMGFYMVAFAFLFNARRRKIVYIAGLSFAFIVSFGRIIQGGHFLSDVVIGGLITLITIHWAYYWMFQKKPNNPEENFH